jgi:tetratricopeptide (TPR) repeat protein
MTQKANKKIPIENASDFSFLGLMWQIERGLTCINARDILWVSKIKLKARAPFEESKRASELYTFGYYYTTSALEPEAFIDLYIEPIFRGVPKFLWWSCVPLIIIVSTLAHEVAHHQHLGLGNLSLCIVENEDPEIVANRYAENTLSQMRKKRKYRLGFWWLKELAEWHYVIGIIDAQAGRYESAMSHFHYAWNFNPQLENVAAYFWSAKDKIDASVNANQ